MGPALHDKLNENLEEIEEIDRGMRVLPSSILLSIVATFDSIIGDFTKELIELDPGAINFGDRSVPYSQLFQAKEIQSIKKKIIESEVNRLLRDSHKEQVRYIEKLIDTNIIEPYERWANFVEVFERRNQYAHANGLITQAYIEKIEREKYPTEDMRVGEPLKLTTSYLHKAVDYLIEFGTLLAFVAWRKRSKDPNSAFGALSNASYSYITKKRLKLASRLLDFALHKQNRKGVEEVRIRQMHVNLANALKKMNKRDESEKILGELDWTAASADFRICIAAVREDVAEVIKLLPGVAASKEISMDAIRTWPVFDWVRSDPKFRDKFREVFGEEVIVEFASPQQDMPEKPSQPEGEITAE